MKIKYFSYHLSVNNPKLLKSLENTKLIVMSDLHFQGGEYDKKRWPHIYKIIREKQPTAIILAGDVVDSADIVDDPKALREFKHLLKKLLKIAPVYIGIGNHDFHVFTARNMMVESRGHFQKLLEFYSKIKGLMILDNKTCTIGKLNLIGLTLPHQYYYRNENYTRIHENKALLKKLIKTIKTKEHYYNLALIHSPYHLDQKTLNLVKNLDLVIAGHAHNGCVPPLISKIFRGDRGIASADKRPFAKRSRNTFKKSKGRLITLGAITTLPDTLKRLDRAFPSEIAELTFTSDPFISVPKSCIIKI